MNTRFPERTALATALLLLAATPALATALLLLAETPALATGANIFGGQDPLAVFVSFMTGPFAYGLVIVGILATGASLVFGSDFSGFARRMPLVAVAGGVVILADNVVNALFSVTTGASVPPDLLLQPWPWPTATEAGP